MKIIIKYSMIIWLLVTSVACEDYLDRFPLDSPSDETFFENETELEMAVSGVYNRLWYWPAGTYWVTSFDFASDDGWDRNGSPLQALGRGEQNSDNSYTNGFWSHFYRAIGRANFIISRSEHLAEEMEEADFNRLVGEVRFLRAFFYAYLSELYGDIPLVTHFIGLEEAVMPRTPKSEVVDFILSELGEISGHLPDDATEKGRATRGAVLTLKSRVALWNERWSDVVDAAETMMADGTYQIDDDYARIFTFEGSESPEVVMQIQYLRGVQTHNLPRNFFSRMTLGHSNKKPPQDLVDSYGDSNGVPIDESPIYDPLNPNENRDPRLHYTLVLPGTRFGNWIYETNPDSTMTWDFTLGEYVTNVESSHAYASFTGYLYRKHTDLADYPTNVGASEQNLLLFRYAEVLLNYAEAKVELNQLDNSVYNALNAIRQRPTVDIDPLVAGHSQQELRNLVRKERRNELGMEGLRYFDIRRWRIAEDVIPGPYRGRVNRYAGGHSFLNEAPEIDEIGTPNYDNVSNADDMVVIETRSFNSARDYLWPIPRIELETNPLLEQNPGYTVSE